MATVLLVEDDPGARQGLELAFVRAGLTGDLLKWMQFAAIRSMQFLPPALFCYTVYWRIVLPRRAVYLAE